jgi:putative nucleotidyltransferase with HDIG domain
VPTQLVFVPMLFVLPTAAVPLVVIAASLLARIPEYVSGAVHISRAGIRIAENWYAVGPALVLMAANATTPAWSDWPIYVAALASQFALDLLITMLREPARIPLHPLLLWDELRAAYVVDAALSPIGLLAAFAAAQWEWAFLLVLPLIGLIRVFGREREARIENALTLSSAYRGTALLLGEVLTNDHEYTGAHSRGVVVLAHQTAQALGLDDRTKREVEFGALLHDVGKIAIPNEIINKPGRLTNEEMDVMRTHTLEGERMLKRIGGVLGDVGEVVRSHHEFYDGNGYPDGLSGDRIPIASRVIACCDAFNAMTTDRPYRAAMTVDAAVAELETNAGTQFDPVVVGALVEIVRVLGEPDAATTAHLAC